MGAENGSATVEYGVEVCNENPRATSFVNDGGAVVDDEPLATSLQPTECCSLR